MNSDFLKYLYSPHWGEPLLRKDEHYKIIPFIDERNCSVLRTNGKRISIGDKGNKICRFCHKTEKETSFRNISHAVPEFLGNHCLISYEECDECNAFFSKTVENNLAKNFDFYRTLSRISGKNGVPSYRPGDESFRIDYDSQKGLNIRSRDDFFKIDEKNKTLKLRKQSAPYIPIEAWRCLFKMAFSLMPSDKLIFFQNSIQWLRYGDIQTPPWTSDLFKVLFSFTPEHMYYGMQHIFLERIDDTHEVPFMMYAIAFKNFTFQIFLPSIDNDKHLHSKKLHLNIPSGPHLFLREEKFNISNTKYCFFDWSGKEKKTDIQTAQLSFQFIEGKLIKN